jgi:sigma-B regulation protein RsbU (phosphoserine phosphatase)
MEPNQDRLQQEVNNLRLAVEELSLLNEVAVAIGSLTEVSAITDLIVSKCTKKLKAEQGCILLLSQDESSPFKTYVRKIEQPTSNFPIHVSTTLMGWMIKNQGPLIINDLPNDSRFQNLALKSDFRSLLLVPLKHRNKLTGLFAMFNKAGDFDQSDQRLLSIVSAQSAQIIENARLHEEEKKLQEIEKELLVAKEIQQGLLPKVMPQIPEFDIFGYSLPSKQVGGDFFDFVTLPDGRLCLGIADVSGKGTPAALLMANLQATLRSQILANCDPARAVANANRLLCQSVEKGKFATLVHGCLDPKAKKLAYVNAGHNPPFLFRGKELLTLDKGGLILGVLEDAPYEHGETTLKSGDLLIMYTDGVTEAHNETEALFEEERLIRAVRENLGLSAKDLAHKIVKEVQAFQGLQPQSDDITLVIVKVS